jgi:CTP synthase
VPHITDEIKYNFFKLGETGKYDIVITELGGCVGDIESLPFIEGVRQVRLELNPEDTVVLHLTLVPYLEAARELKTKPTQHSVKLLLEAGVQPDILLCRAERHLPMDIRKKIALFCNVNINSVIEAIDADTIYDVPLLMRKEKLDERVLFRLNLPIDDQPDIAKWKEFLGRLKNPLREINVGIVGKYVELPDAYKSIAEAFVHAGAENECKVKVRWISSESISEENVKEVLEDLHGIVVAPGFGERGIIGKLVTVRYARENKVPFFGICLGMQCAVVEFAQNVLKLEDAASTEMKTDAKNPVIDIMEEQKHIQNKGGTMRLGAYPCKIKKGTLAAQAYGKTEIQERHRHRYEFNNKYLEAFEKAGMIASGINPDSNLVEIMELKGHPWFLGTQFHPELKSTVQSPHPLFVSFVAAGNEYRKTLGT